MALAANTALASFGQVQGQFLDLSDILAELIRGDNTAFLSRVPMVGVATEVQHSWVGSSARLTGDSKGKEVLFAGNPLSL